ncbi:UDP-N-acetylglucosamine 2-epimerase (non-hydrolyzing) [Paucibacter oligotrophus]|uniref:Probable UDP-N-acetylglucosamine 2-epimerase n=1 Tax=Roseateles oligotrophus TaxID=1769250 RepID=A0A840LBC8_9BURK|nr:UDP-N-acetylglucosamine 2-epimerase (non-hydrolyzing) [Roseateles oligotrophus]MBB4844145.1 UDP-N-acetylglucosamine 2-epimerase (non-hydrolyzing) [Roseateles oligotrophus]
MSKLKVLAIFGTRPEAIKMAPVVLELQRRTEQFEVQTCVTAQHRQMLDQALLHFNLGPDFDLDIMQAGQDLFDLTARCLLGLRTVLRQARPDICLVHGDTTTSFAAALAAFYEQIPVGHVEAGLRTNERYSPFPEELNRSLSGRLASLHFAPTASSRDNLLREGIPAADIFVTGNTVIDALLWTVARFQDQPEVRERLHQQVVQNGYTVGERPFVLITGHRRENFGEGFKNVCQALLRIAQERPDIDLVYPLHLNPNVKLVVEEMTAGQANIHLIPPLEYESFAYLMLQSTLILTDSGGIQEEGPSLGKPVLVMRDVTERPEAVLAGSVRLVGTSAEKIVANVLELLNQPQAYQAMSQAKNPYGDGTAARQIAAILSRFKP